MTIIVVEDRHIVKVNNKRYMFFMCFKINDEYYVCSHNRNMIVTYHNNNVLLQFVSDTQFNIKLQDINLYVYAFEVDQTISNNLEHLKFIFNKSNDIKHLFQLKGFFDNDNTFIKLLCIKLRKSQFNNKTIQDIYSDEPVKISFYYHKNICSLPNIEMSDYYLSHKLYI